MRAAAHPGDQPAARRLEHDRGRRSRQTEKDRPNHDPPEQPGEPLRRDEPPRPGARRELGGNLFEHRVAADDHGERGAALHLRDGDFVLLRVDGGDVADRRAERAADDLFRSDADLRQAVADAVTEWNTKIPNLNLVNDNSNADADIEVQLVDGLRGMVAGATVMRFDEDGFINKATILLPKAAFFIEGDSQVFAIQYDSQKLKEIATHEMGHALGLGHADFDSDLMSENLDSDETVNISQCHIDGVLQANQWKFINNDTIPNNPNEDEVSC